MPGSAPAPTLPQLQNLMKRDPDGYADEYAQRLRHFRSSLQLHTAVCKANHRAQDEDMKATKEVRTLLSSTRRLARLKP